MEKMNEEVFFETEKSIVKLEEGILCMISKPGTYHDLKESMLKFSYARKLVPVGKIPLMLDARKVKETTPDLRAYFSSNKACSLIQSMAVVVDSLSMRIMGNFFIHFTKPSYPTKLFTNEHDAKAWLMKFEV